MATYTARSRSTTAVTGTTGAALSREAAIAAVVAGVAAGNEAHVYNCNLVSAAGPTGTYSTSFNTTGPLTGATFSATSHDLAAAAAAAAGPTGPAAGIDIWSVDPPV
jgi:hypothetical protein